MDSDQANEAWYAVRVKPNFEKQVTTILDSKGYEGFLPCYTATRRYSKSTKREVQIPLFPGYVFCRFDARFRLPVLTTPGVVHILGISGIPEPIDATEIESIRRCVETISSVEPWPFVDQGGRVRIDEGPLAGVEGVLISAQGACRLVVSITLLCRSVAVAVERHWVAGVPIIRSALRGKSASAA